MLGPMAKQHWLVKSEPDKYPFERLVSDGSTSWDGIRNFEARNNLRTMKTGDLCLFYHSNEGKAVVGIAKVAREAYPEAKAKDWTAVDLEPVRPLARPVTLAEIRAHHALAEMMVLRRPRLSVSPVTKGEFDAIVALSKERSPNEE